MKRSFSYLLILLIILFSCKNNNTHETSLRIRPLKDTVGFAQYKWQMDSIMARTDRSGWNSTGNEAIKLAICSHDDYTYVGKLYPELLHNVKANNVFLIGVAHSAAKMGIEDSLVFESFDYWKGPWKNVRVSPVRNELLQKLRGVYAIVSDTLQKTEHSIEAMIPFLQYFNKDVTIIPILVPAMSPERMLECGKGLSSAIGSIAAEHKWEWGKDFAIIVTTDAVHYGNEDWGGRDMAPYGCDETGNKKALEHEYEIINSCFTGPLTTEKIKLFNSFTIKEENYREYKWTWCGRYCVPVAMYTSLLLGGNNALTGKLTGYSTSITSGHINVDDLWMGRTAIATKCHWVGYAAIAFK